MVEQTQVIVVGAGPVGLMVAGELRLGGAEVIVLEQRTEISEESRASTLHARTMEIFDARGLLDDLGAPANEQMGHFGGIPLDLTVESRFSGLWKVPQTRTEELLCSWTTALGADLRRGWRVSAVRDDGDGVVVTAEADGRTRLLRAAFVVGADGTDSTVRELLGAECVGESATRELLRADVVGIEIRPRRFERLERGFAVAARNPAGVTRLMVHRYGCSVGARSGEPSFAEVVRTWHEVTGEDIGRGRALWVNAFDDTSRLLREYRTGRVFFVGDAAHQQMPSGGQALNLGLQDAVNLGWKLAVGLDGTADELLDSYHGERHAVGSRILANIRVQTELLLGGPQVESLRRILGELIAQEQVRAHLAGMISGVDIRYPAEPGSHPWLGSRLPDLPRVAATAAATPREGRAVMLGFRHERVAELRTAVRPWSHRVEVVSAGPDDRVGDDALLVRPDGYVVWAGSEDETPSAGLRRWFGAPRSVN
ncbi:FAD-dependent monooxygenase [Nocardia halotolerans]|uniref:FAD-dependent monooxygenase n=1 Tax=Nocardia halotolerans TaxID=1755878 RepID=A0ABV8VHM6_9NOCA